jgi:hypothetical protein
MARNNSPVASAGAQFDPSSAPRRVWAGPISIAWLSAAAHLPGKSLHVGVALWFTSGLQGSPVVSLTNSDSLRFGLDRNAKYRALTWLEEAGLIAVERRLGRAPRVTILSRWGLYDQK